VLEVADGGMVAGPARGCARGERTTGWVGAPAERALVEVTLNNICKFNSL